MSDPTEETMSNQIMNDPKNPTEAPAEINRLLLYRVINDLILAAFTLYLVRPIIQVDIAKIIVACILGVLASHMLGYTLIKRGRYHTGLGTIIYGLITGLFITSLFIEGFGVVSFLVIFLFTLVSVSYGFTRQQMIAPVVTRMR